MSHIRILLVDDDEEEFLLTQYIINDIPGDKYKLNWENDYKIALSLLKENAYDAYLIDYKLGKHTGLELIREAVEYGCISPMILLTGEEDEHIDLLASSLGASDYLLKKNLSARELERSIRYCTKASENIFQIKQLNNTLEIRVKERTDALEKIVIQLKEKEFEILQTLEKERELNELKSRFLTLTSHEFRTPLSTILSSASLIESYVKQQECDKISKHTTRIKSTVKYLNSILQDFLNLSKIEEGKTSVHIESVAIESFIMDIVEELQLHLKAAQYIETHFNLISKTWHTDPIMLKNSIINLISNASKYSGEGTRITIEVIDDASWHTVVVSDQGQGIPSKDIQHLFTRFYRASNSEQIPGTGLGLHLVKKYMELLQGTVSVKSTLGEGSSFTLKFKNTTLIR